MNNMTENKFFETEIIQEAKNQAKDIIQEAEGEATKILDQVQNENVRITRERLVEIEKAEEQKAKHELSRLRLKNKIELMNVKESLLEHIFMESLKRIKGFQDQKSEIYRTSLTNKIIQGGVSLLGGELIIELAADDVSLIDIGHLESQITKISGAKTTIKVTPAEADTIKGGLIIRKGSLSVDNTHESIFNRRKEIIRNRVHDILYSE